MTIATDAPAKRRVAPFEGIIRRLSRKEADAEVPGLTLSIARSREVSQIDGWVAGMLGLARGAVFVPNEHVRSPFMCVAEVNGHRTHVVVAREYGDVSWPAYLARQRRTARDEASRIVQRGLSDVRAWLTYANTEGAHL